MKWPACILFAAVLILTASAHAQEAPGTLACGHVDCDCENIDAGILNLGWVPDCRGCQASIREQCTKTFKETGSLKKAMEKAGYCQSCNVIGPHPYPRPGRLPSALPPAARKAFRDELCRMGGAHTHSEVRSGAVYSQGCLNENGKRQGIWVEENGDDNTVTVTDYSETGEVHSKLTRNKDGKPIAFEAYYKGEQVTAWKMDE